MKVIPLLGIINCFFPLIFLNSKRALLVTINGIIFHSLDISNIKNKKNNNIVNFLKYYDIICNCIMISYTTFYYPFVMNYTLLALLFYLIEVYCVEYTTIPYYKTDLIHIIVHSILAYGIFLTI